MKSTVLKDGPGTILDRKARLHRALDAALDKRAKDDYHFADPPKKPKPIVTFLDRYVQSKAEEAKKVAAKDSSQISQTGSTRYEVSKAPANVAPMVKVIPRSKRPVVDSSSSREAVIKKADNQGHQPATIAKFLGISKEEVLKVLGKKAKDSEKDAWKRDTDAGSAQLVKKDAAAGMSAAKIVAKYGFSKSFVDEVLGGKAKDVARV